MKIKLSKLNLVFIGHLVFFGLIVTGLLPRSLVLYETLALIVYLAWAPIEDGIVFFVRSIPLFIAIPLTANFDNFNQWRVLVIVLFLKFIISNFRFSILNEFSIKQWFKRNRQSISLPLIVLFILACASVLVAGDKSVAIKRIIYFVNAGLIGIVVWYYARGREFAQRLVRNIAIPTLIVTLVGAIQVISTYLIDIYQFMRIWGEGIQFRQFGTQWSYIATHVGNTWFAYYGDQLSLRVFSLFPDSHSFPIFLLLGLPAVFVLFKKTRDRIIWSGLIFLMIILSGTRGMWLAGAVMVVWSLLLMGFLKYKGQSLEKRKAFTGIGAYLILFILLFGIAYPILSSPQFLVSKPNALLLEHRLRSVLDFGETSNAARIGIWKASAKSIIAHPVLGVGIGNFPVVLGQNILLSRAGSSAHNIYIHLAAEMGILAFLAGLYLVWLIIRRLYLNFIEGKLPDAYNAALLITLPWILAYLMTDVALFDERALLLFCTTLGLIFYA